MLETLLDGKNWFPVVIPLTAFVALAFVALWLASRSLWSSGTSGSTST
jgi:hypothetical protein